MVFDGGEGDGSAVLFDDIEDGGEADAGAMVVGFSGKEPLEDMGLDCLGDAGAGIGDLEVDIATWGQWGGRSGGGVGEGKVGGTEGENTPVGHGIAGVDAEVEQHLVEAGGISGHRPQVRVAGSGDMQVAGEGIAGHAGEVVDETGAVDGAFDAFAAAGEAEQLADHVGGALGGGLDGFDEQLAVFLGDLRAQEGGAHEDGGEDIIKVMGDSAGEGAHGFDALSALEVGLGTFHLRDVPGDALEANDVAMGIAQG